MRKSWIHIPLLIMAFTVIPPVSGHAQGLVVTDKSGMPRIVLEVDEGTNTPRIVLISDSGEVSAVIDEGFIRGTKRTEATAYLNSEGYLTDNLMRVGCQVLYESGTWVAILDTFPQPDWNRHYVSGGRFDLPDSLVAEEYGKAGKNTVDRLHGILGGNMRIVFTIRGYTVGTYENGRMVLKASASVGAGDSGQEVQPTPHPETATDAKATRASLELELRNITLQRDEAKKSLERLEAMKASAAQHFQVIRTMSRINDFERRILEIEGQLAGLN